MVKKLNFGTHRGKTYWDMLKYEKSYVDWIINNKSFSRKDVQ